MFRLSTCIALASVIQLGLTADFASADPHFAPAPSTAEVHQGTGSAWGNPLGVVNGGQFGSDYHNVPAQVPDISGLYFIAGRPCQVRQWGGRLLFINEWGSVSEGIFLNPRVVQALHWDHGLIGILNRNRIEWANGTVWFKR